MGLAQPTTKASYVLQYFQQELRCIADADGIACFASGPSYVDVRRVRDTVAEPTSLAVLISSRIAQMGGVEAVLKSSGEEYIRVSLESIKGIAPLHQRTFEEIGGPTPIITITKIVPQKDGWDLTVRKFKRP